MVPLVFVLAAPSAARGREPRTAIEVSSVSPPEGDIVGETILSRLAETLTERLTQEGFQVVARDAAPDLVVSVSVGVPDCLLRATLPRESVERRVLGCGVLLADDQLELVHKATELVRAAYRREEVAPPAPPDVSPDVSPRRPAAAAPPPLLRAVASPPLPPTAWEISTGLDLQVRADRLDPVARVGGRLRLNADWALHVTTGLSRPTSDPVARQPLEVTEGTMLAGLGRRIHDGERLRIEGIASLGALVHHFDDGSDTGTRFDLLAALALTGTVRLSRHLGVEVRLAPGMSGTEYRHVAGNVVIWQGARQRLDAGLGVVFH